MTSPLHHQLPLSQHQLHEELLQPLLNQVTFHSTTRECAADASAMQQLKPQAYARTDAAPAGGVGAAGVLLGSLRLLLLLPLLSSPMPALTN